MNIFRNFDNIPLNYIPDNTTVLYLPIVENAIRPLIEYNAKNEPIGFSWHYRDSVVLDFHTTGTILYDNEIYEDACEYLKGKNFIISFYNFKYEEIYRDCIPASFYFEYYIKGRLACKLIPGNYYMTVTLVDKEHCISQTLINYDDFAITIR